MEAPELRLIQGGGEGVAETDGFAKPDLYVVPGPVEAPEADDGTDPAASRGNAALQAVRALRVNEGSIAYMDVAPGDETRKKAGGGGWLIREHMKKLEAEAKDKAEAEAQAHEDACTCKICTNL